MRSRVINPRRPALATLLSGLLAITTLAILDGHFPGAIQRFDAAALDYMVGRATPEPTGNVVIAAIDDASLHRLGRWAWQHRLEAQLVDTLMDYKVSVVGFDIWFVDPSANERTKAVDTPDIDDDALRKAIMKQGATFIGYYFNGPLSHRPSSPIDQDPSLYRTTLADPPPLAYDLVLNATPDAETDKSLIMTTYGPPIEVLNSAARRHTAFLNVEEDLDGNVRSFPTVIVFKGHYYAPFFLALADAFLGQPQLRLSLADQRITGVALGNRTIPVDEMGRMMVRYRGPAGTIPQYSVVDIINHKVAPSKLSGKIVLVGATAEGLADFFATPVGSNFPGVEVQANAVDNVLAGHFLYRSLKTDRTERIIGCIMAGIITSAAVFLTAAGSFLLATILLAGTVVYTEWRIASDGALIGFGFSGLAVAVTYAAVATTRWRTVAKQKKYTNWIAEHYLSPNVFGQIDPDNPGAEEDEEDVSIMFADLSGFTQQSRAMGPKALRDQVNRYFGEVVPPVDATNGYIERFLGDAMLAFWTARPAEDAHPAKRAASGIIRFLREKGDAPAPDSNHAVRAVRAAIAIVERVKFAREADEARNERGFTIKVGINSGPASIGNVGGRGHFSYSLQGKAVNFASRLESVPPLYGCFIVVGENTAHLVRDEFLLRELDWILVKDAKEPMTIYQPIAALDQVSDAQKDLVANFLIALEHYRAARFAEACSIWEDLVVKYEPAPSPSSVMATRARDFMTSPPALPWNAIYVRDSK